MELTFVALWLNNTFVSVDLAILQFWHDMAEIGGFILTPFFYLVSFTGEKGFFALALGFILLLFRRTRKAGICVLLAVALGALFTNLILKDIIARPRPYADVTAVFYSWWQFVGSPIESDLSFPSGHTTAAMAAMTVIFLLGNKKISWLAFLYVIFMGTSRNYLMVHYPSDVFAGIIVGGVAALLAYGIVRGVFSYAEKKGHLWYQRFFEKVQKEEKVLERLPLL